MIDEQEQIEQMKRFNREVRKDPMYQSIAEYWELMGESAPLKTIGKRFNVSTVKMLQYKTAYKHRSEG